MKPEINTETAETVQTKKIPAVAPAATCCASSFSTAEIAAWLEWLATNVSPQMAAVIRNIRRDVDHPHDGIDAFIQHNASGELQPPAEQPKI